jgi:predicted metal-binding protein
MDQVLADIKALGIVECDAIVIADCVVTRKSCSWVNTDHIDEKILRELDALIQKDNYGISVKVDSVPTRGKYIWEVKVH